MIKYIQISIFLLAAIYGSEPIIHSVSLEYSVTEKFKLFSLKDIISVEIEGKNIEIITNLEEFKSLQNVYLQENYIYTLVNDPFKGLSKII